MGSQYVVEPFRHVDGEGVAHLFTEVYGDKYPFQMVYHREELIRAVDEGACFPFCVRTASGRVIGYGSLYRSAPFPGIYEFGQGLVSPDFQGAGLGRLLFEFVEGYLPTLPGAQVYFGEAVCNHTHTQKAGANIKTIETGLEIDLMPGYVYGAGENAPKRVAAVDMFRTFVPRPHIVYLPEVYEDIMRSIYEGFDDGRTLCLSLDAHQAGATKMSTRVFDFAQVARISVPVAGEDFLDCLEEEERCLRGRNIRVTQVWLSLASPAIGRAVDALRMRGYFFGAVCPRWFDDDGLLMQRIDGEPDWGNVRLYSPRTEKIFGVIHEDWQSVAREEEE
ncbi:MAG: hypothetical protein BWK76_23275 [Desulfobulbaceae bacterium A2]|nr:MAG: hypothetical protein BWK76_23275 [Desulfobulbaceae bacterium A2]